tara:strand:+ start:5022 stop:5573 length:552 start_codon:yes stop_codon:yes gene_type:complete
MLFNLRMYSIFNKFRNFALLGLTIIVFTGCNGLSKTSTRDVPVNAQERARKNVEEGRGAGLGNVFNRGATNYEFSSSNPMWRASLELLDFLPLSTVDYSGGVIVSDWYSDSSRSDESIKISVRFLSNEVRSDSLKIIIHKKKCSTSQNCTTSLQKNSKIINELRKSILAKAAIFEKEKKSKKK